MKFKYLVDIETGKLNANAADEDGVFPFYTCADIPLRINTIIGDYECLLLVGNGANTGKVFYNNGPFNAYQRTYILRAKDERKTRQYYWFLRGKTDFLMTRSVGSATNYIKLGDIENLEFPENDDRELDKAVSSLALLDNMIVKRNKELQFLNELVKARFVEMFSNENNMMKMSDICEIITDGTHQPPKFVEDGIPFIFVSNIVTNKLTYDAEKYITQETYDELIKRTPIEIGDVLLSTVGSYGHPAVVESDRKFLFQRHIAYLKPKKEIIDSYYLHGAILSPKVQRQIEEGVKGIAQKTLNLGEIKKMVIPVPDLTEQKQFGEFVEEVDKSKSIVQKSLEETQLLFDSLMQDYFG